MFVKRKVIDSIYNHNSVVTDYITFEEYMDRWLNVFFTRFKADNLPEELILMDIERFLFMYGRCIFFYDEYAKKYVCLPPMHTDGLTNIYGRPVSWAVKGLGTEPYYVSDLTPDKVVEIRNNAMCTPSVSTFKSIVRRLYELERTISININAQKTPILITCPENQRFSFKNLFKQWEGFMPVIFGTDQMNSNQFNVLRSDAPFVADRLYNIYQKTFNELLAYGGFMAMGNEKSAQMNDTESRQSTGLMFAQRYAFLQPREQAVNEINKKFGLNIKIQFNDVDLTDMMLAEPNLSMEEIEARKGDHV